VNVIQTQSAGFGPFLRKELLEWWKGRAALVMLVAVGGLGILGTLATRIDEWTGGTTTSGMLQPTANVLGAKFDQWILFAGIFASIGILTQERATGTLAWTLSKPMSRSALLLAKWTAAMVMLTAFTVVLPLAISVGVATWSYGTVPDLAAVARYGLVLAALPAFFVALNLALATRLGSQAAIAAIAFAVLAVPYFIGGFLPAVTEFWPTSIAAMAGPFATESTVHVPTVAGWAVALLAIGAGGLASFNLEDM
jgi:ABC-type transport system involved in multi-copper enzyme maturation permease subunit